MSTKRIIIKCITIHAACIALLCLWQVNGMEWAGNLVQFWFCLMGGLGVLAMFTKATGSTVPRMPELEKINWFFWLLYVGTLAAVGSFAVAAIYFFGAFGWVAYRKQFDDAGQLLKKA